jgi:hypothetical protein
MVTKSYIAKVTDGHLLLQLKDLGDLDPNAVIHALVIGSTAADTTAPTVAVSLAPWQQSTAIAQPIYFAVDFSEPVTGFTADSVTVGGTATQATLAKTVTGIGANYVVAVSGFTASGTVTLNVPAGKATDLSGNQNQAAPSAATVTYSKPTSVLQYAFGAADSPLANGYTRVTRQTAYNGSSQKYGWASGTVVDWDRKGNGAALVRGFSFTGDGTFQADVANGTYRVDLILGDLGQYGHDQVGIFLQGETTARETVTTSRGQVLSKRYDSVTVSDGHLKVRLKDQGGDDPNAVLQAIDIALM